MKSDVNKWLGREKYTVVWERAVGTSMRLKPEEFSKDMMLGMWHQGSMAVNWGSNRGIGWQLEASRNHIKQKGENIW